MSNLDFLEVNQNFITYYQTLRDANYYFRNRPEVQNANEIIAELILNFIEVNGTTFRDMNPEEYENIYRIFEDDFIGVIISSSRNNVDLPVLAGLIDDIIGIARLRANTLQKLNRTSDNNLLEDLDIIIIQDDEQFPGDASEIYVTISDGNEIGQDDDENEESPVELNLISIDDESVEENEDEPEINEVLINDEDPEDSVEIIHDADGQQSYIKYRYENS